MQEQSSSVNDVDLNEVLNLLFNLGTPSEIKTVLSGKNSHVGRPPPLPVWEFFRRNTVFF